MTNQQPLASKYQPLEAHLKHAQQARIPLTFGEIEKIIRTELPPSARKHRAWWSNNPSNSVITYAWLSAGYKTADVNIAGERVTFVKQGVPADAPDGSQPVRREGRHPLWGALKGTTIVAEGVDLTQPIDAEWGSGHED